MNALDSIIPLAQKCLEHAPVIVLGSGASAAYGVSSMGALQDHLLNHIVPAAPDADIWGKFKVALNHTGDLEQALHDVQLPPQILCEVVRQARSLIVPNDLQVFARVACDGLRLPLTNLFRHLFRSTHTRLSVVTTNYDRLAEYAVDAAEVTHHTGFSHGYRRHFRSPCTLHCVPARHRVVDIWKVHGSIDWFRDRDGLPVALPYHADYPPVLTPLLVTPGISKYETVLQEPFRSVIAQADQALTTARSFLCVGYGFNDAHIEPKLVSRIRQQLVPIVILAHTLRPNAKRFLCSAACQQTPFLALEASGTGTRAYYREMTDGIVLPDCSLWDFQPFLDTVLGNP